MIDAGARRARRRYAAITIDTPMLRRFMMISDVTLHAIVICFDIFSAT